MLLPFYFFTLIPYSLTAQTTFTQRIQQNHQGEGTLTLHQSKAIDDLVNNPANNTTTTAPRKQSEGKTATPTTANAKDSKVKATPNTEKSDTLGADKKLARGTRTNGYRVQVYAGGNSRKDRQQAEAARDRIKTLFPETAVSVHFHSPRWICRAGNFRTYEEAHQMLEEVRAMGYQSAIIIKSVITVQ